MGGSDPHPEKLDDLLSRQSLLLAGSYFLFAVYGGIEPPSPDRQSGIVAVGPIDLFVCTESGNRTHTAAIANRF